MALEAGGSPRARMFVIQKLSEEGGSPPYDTVVMTDKR